MNNNQRNLKGTTGGGQKKTVYMREKVHKYLHSRGGFSNTWWPLWEESSVQDFFKPGAIEHAASRW